MANVENIKPYADFAHEAAQHGGVDSYLDELADANYDLGSTETRAKDIKIGVTVLAVMALVKAGKWAYSKADAYFNQKKEEARLRSENAKAAIKAECEAIEETPM